MGTLRRTALTLWGALLLLHAGAVGAAPRSVWVAADAAASPELTPLARGAGQWLARALGEAGLEARAGHPTADPAALVAEAAQRGAAYAVSVHLRTGGDATRLRLRLYPAGRPEPLAAATADAPLASLGEALVEATGDLLGRLGQGAAAPPAPPLLEDLVVAGHALERLDRGELYRAWEEVEGRLTPTAIQLREMIVEDARKAGAPAPERARVLAAAGDDVGAWALISSAAAGPAPDRAVRLAAAEVHLARGAPPRALEILEPLVAGGGGDAEVQLLLGRAHAGSGRAGQARRALERAAELRPESPRPLRLIERLDGMAPPERARALLRAGAREAQRLDAAHAERLLERAAELDPNLAESSWRERARLEQRLGRHARALAAWQRVASEGGQTGDAETWAGIGHAQRALGDPAAASSLERALALEPDHATALVDLGRVKLTAGHADAALPSLRRAVALAPEDELPRVTLVRALRDSGRTEEALAVLTTEEAKLATRPSLLRQAARLLRDTGDLAGARETLAQAVALEPWNAELLEELASLDEALGDGQAAAQARALAGQLREAIEDWAGAGGESAGGANLDELVLGFSRQVGRATERRVAQLGVREHRPWRIALLRWLHPRSPDLQGLGSALDEAVALRFAFVRPVAPESAYFAAALERLWAFDEPISLDAEAIARVNSSLDTDAVFVSRLVQRLAAADEAEGSEAICREAGGFEIETRLLSGRHPDVASILLDTECLPGGLASHGVWNRRALALYGLALLALLFPLLRGWGTLLVDIELPPRTRGFLHIRIARKPQEVGNDTKKRKRKTEGRLKRSLRSFGRFQKRMAGRETVFRWIPARRRPYYVTVRGPLYDALGDHEIGQFLEEQQVRIERGRLARLTYDFNPNEVALQITVMFRGEPLRGARVALRDDPHSLRYARDGSAFLYVGKGEHVVCAGGADRATECRVEVKSLGSALPVGIDLEDEGGLMVRGCPEAVEPYLVGDFSTAAAALAAAGEEQLAHLMRGAHHQQRGEIARAADAYEAAGCIEEAAELRATGADHQGSAELFERAGDHARAAEAHRAGGDFEQAARCYETAYDYDSAIECWEAAGDVERVIGLHEKVGSYLQAASLAFEHGDLERALRNLQQVERRDASYGDACRLTAEVLALRGEFDVAAEKQAKAIEWAGGENAPVEMHRRHAELLAEAGDKPAALQAYETLRRLDPGREEVTQHIEALRDEISRTRAEGAKAAPTGSGEPSRYELLGVIGRGGMGVVYKARDRRLGRVVALKRLPDELRDNATAAKLFLREAQAAASLNHRNIVTVYDAGEENGVYHITMELLEGLPLNRIQEKRGRIGPADVARLGGQICAGLQYAHDRRIVHRDIKTANLFFTRDKVVKIMDFGLAKTIEEVRRNSTVIGGTPYYMAPEQAEGGAIDHRTDLYALGVTLYRLLTGTFPFVEGDLIYHHRSTPPPDPREHVAELPAALAELLLELLAKQPDARPESAAAVAERLQAARSTSR